MSTIQVLSTQMLFHLPSVIQNTNGDDKFHFKSGAKDHLILKEVGKQLNLLTMAPSCFSCSLHEDSLEYLVPGAQGKSNMAGYGKQILVRDAFLWFMSAIYLFAFSSFYIQIPGRSFYLLLLMSIFFSQRLMD